AVGDVGVPGLDGYEIARRPRVADERRAILLVAVTGYGSPEDRERSLLAGFDVHLVKPVDPEMLAGVLARTTAQRSPEPRAMKLATKTITTISASSTWLR